MADAPGQARDLTKKQGVEGLKEARKRLGLPDKVGEPGSFYRDPTAIEKAKKEAAKGG